VLNAKPENVEREAEIVAQSGRVGAVTIATNMAGRGTDILLGGNAEFMARLKLREALMPRCSAVQCGERAMQGCAAEECVVQCGERQQPTWLGGERTSFWAAMLRFWSG
ncbi:unnamed protein product, partial [Closterium sp. NIES-54]